MPKEMVHSRHQYQVPNEPIVHVGWTKDAEHVQLASIQPNGVVLAWDEETQQHVKTETEWPGWFVQLDRAGINRLIRVLRKARDEAFGADA